jgi:hypothetical protein
MSVARACLIGVLLSSRQWPNRDMFTNAASGIDLIAAHTSDQELQRREPP